MAPGRRTRKPGFKGLILLTTHILHRSFTAKLLGSKWTISILRELADGPRRFSEIERALEICPRTLSKRLKRLAVEGVVFRSVFPDAPPRVEYGLTPKGQALLPALSAIQACDPQLEPVDH